jgi:hypothetical protein
MEDYVAFAETFSAYVYYKLPWKARDSVVQKVFGAQWGLLREVALFVVRHRDGQHTEDRLFAMERKLEAYGKLLGQVWHWRSSLSACCHCDDASKLLVIRGICMPIGVANNFRSVARDAYI